MNLQNRYYFPQILRFLMNRKKLISLIIAGMMTISPIYAIAHDDADESGEMKTSIALTLQGIPEDVEHGTIKVDEDTPEEQLTRLATTSIEDAIATAHQVMQGKIIKAELDEAEDFLVWEVEVAHEGGSVTVLKIDAGNGKLLAAEQDEEAAWWQFWE